MLVIVTFSVMKVDYRFEDLLHFRLRRTAEAVSPNQAVTILFGNRRGMVQIKQSSIGFLKIDPSIKIRSQCTLNE